MIVRAATPDDAAGVNAVYNPFIETSAATFETEPISDPDRRAWLARLAADPRYPVVICADEDGRVRGFANAAPFDPRAGYATSVKTSVFVDPGFARRGAGSALYRALFDRLGEAALHRAYALIVVPNPASIALHESFGFVRVSILNEVGRKFGRFHSVAWYEKPL